MENERNLEKELDELKATVSGLSEQLMAFLQSNHLLPPACDPEVENPKVGHVEKMVGMIPQEHLAKELDRLENACGESGTTGRITYLGVFASGGRQSTWMRNDVNTDNLLSLAENGTADKVLKCIGSQEKLNVLVALLRQPRTVQQLVDECGFSSTGQVYHHLKPLLAANVVEESARGQYNVVPHRVQGLVMLLAGICDLTDPQHSQGNFAD